MEFDRYALGVLVSAKGRPKLDPKTADVLQDAHMAHLADLHDQGHLLVAGPLLVSAETRERGFLLFRGDVEGARRLMERDPLIREGQLELQLYPWMVPAGTMTFHPSRFPRSMAEAGG